jgi:hypothetical protein
VTKSTHDPQLEWISKAVDAVGIPGLSQQIVGEPRRVWFRNPLNHSSLRLTLPGYNWFTKRSKFAFHKITLAAPINGNHMLKLERLFHEPYYLQGTGNVIFVMGETDAIMLQLHAGNLGQYLDNLSI